jgi:hypothetical protein
MLAFKIQRGTSPEFDRNEGFEFEGSRHMKKLNKHSFTVVSFIILLAIGCPTVVANSALTSASPLSTTARFAPSTPSGCYPQTNKGNCYEPGEMCRSRDHGASCVAGDGESISCQNNDGWRWEPAS